MTQIHSRNFCIAKKEKKGVAILMLFLSNISHVGDIYVGASKILIGSLVEEKGFEISIL